MITLTDQFNHLLEQEKKLVDKIWDKLQNNPVKDAEYGKFTTLSAKNKLYNNDSQDFDNDSYIEVILKTIIDGDADVPIIRLEIDKKYPSTGRSNINVRLNCVDILAKHLNI